MKLTLEDLKKLDAKDPKVKYGFAKELIQIGISSPELLYPFIDNWIDMLHNHNSILRWTAVDILGYLSAVDTESKIDPIISLLFQMLHGGNLINCNHASFALGLIAKYKPQFKNEILNELANISNDVFDTEECKNIAVGKVILIYNDFIEDIIDNPIIIDFIQSSLDNSRNATKTKSIALFKKIENLQKK